MSAAFVALPATSPFQPRPRLSITPVRPPPRLSRRRPVARVDYNNELRPSIGFTMYAEVFNGRAAMIGFVATVAIELATGKGVVDLFLAFTGSA